MRDVQVACLKIAFTMRGNINQLNERNLVRVFLRKTDFSKTVMIMFTVALVFRKPKGMMNPSFLPVPRSVLKIRNNF